MYLIIDIGGTKTLLALFNSRGRVIKKFKFKTPENKSEFLGILESSLVPFAAGYGAKIQQIVIAVPGIVKDNIAAKFGNRPWKDVDLAKSIHKFFHAPVTLKNDADLATVYESSFHRGLSLYLTFSTGIGGGLARKSQLTKNTTSVEPGHTVYIFEGRHLEWEDIASCAAIGAAYHCEATSVRGQDAYSDIAFRVSLGLPELIHRYHPDFIIIGGPLGVLFPHFERELKQNVKNILKTGKLPRIVVAKRPKESVIYGGYTYAKKLKTPQKLK